MNEIPIAELRRELSFNPETGIFCWLVPSPGRRVGGVAGCLAKNGYRVIGIQGKIFLSHRLAFAYMTGDWPPHHIDHKNGIRDDNRWQNLRAATISQNLQNLRRAPRSNKSCGLLGVSRAKKNWQAGIRVNGKRTHLGTFATPELAHDAYLAAKRELHSHCMI